MLGFKGPAAQPRGVERISEGGKMHGIHHITAIAGAPRQNRAFYVDTLGLRMVKKTVNFDDPGT